jgi:uncharacterized membrane protein YhaH (DUF805 family)
MTFGQAIISGFRNYVNFSDRACRSEFWFWTLFATLASIAGAILDYTLLSDVAAMAVAPFQSAVGLALFLPGLAVSVRRLHDLDRTGWWVLLAFTLIGLILLIVWNCMRGTPGPNRFGPDPLAGMP